MGGVADEVNRARRLLDQALQDGVGRFLGRRRDKAGQRIEHIRRRDVPAALPFGNRRLADAQKFGEVALLHPTEQTRPPHRASGWGSRVMVVLHPHGRPEILRVPLADAGRS
jgi:hypothetical protein